jgi:glucokinase
VVGVTIDPIGVLEIGGSHVTSAVVRGDRAETVRRRALHPDSRADELIAVFANAIAESTAPPGSAWVAAIPGPFDYPLGVGRFEGVGKFDSLNGVDLGRRLREALAPRSLELHFVNDAAAFAIGEWYLGDRLDRCVGITLGSGVGSTFLERGRPVTSGDSVPPGGELHLTRLADTMLEDVVSRRAILRRYRSRVELASHLDVKDVFHRARTGDAWAVEVCSTAFDHLGRALDPWLRAFGAEVLIVGGGMAGGWDVLQPALAAGLTVEVALRRSRDPDHSPLIGAAVQLRRHRELTLT